MTSHIRVAELLPAILLLGCVTPPPVCTQDTDTPASRIEPGQSSAASCQSIPAGATSAPVEIDASPTPARILVDGVEIGPTPLRHHLWYSSTTRFIRITAEPLYPDQGRQERLIQVPPLPRRIQFFMNNPAATDREAR